MSEESKKLDNVLAAISTRASNPPVFDPKGAEEERRLAEEKELDWTATLAIAQVVGPVFEKISKAFSAAHVACHTSSGGSPIKTESMTLAASKREFAYANERSDTSQSARIVVGQFDVGSVGIVASHDRKNYFEVARFSSDEVKQMLENKIESIEKVEVLLAEAMDMISKK